MFDKVKAALAGKKLYILAVVAGLVAGAKVLGYDVPQGVIDTVTQIVTALAG